jgi:gamma-glutamyl-gamma-aminobutyrate hydrolase PuuD
MISSSVEPATPEGQAMLAKYQGLVIIPSEEQMSMPVDMLGRVNGQTYPPQDAELATRKVTLIKDTTLTYPTLCFKVYVEPDPAVGAKVDEARFAKMFARAQCRRAETVSEADLVVFGGGSDVDPQLYGEVPHESTFCDPKRDNRDMQLYLYCVENGIPMFGVCRGAQFLHVMNGGKLFQDVDNHNGSHSMFDLISKKNIEKVSSCHHQMVMPNVSNGMEIIATASKSMERWANNKNCFIGAYSDIEAFFYRDTCCIGVQGHPEYEGYHYFTKWCLDLLEELVFNSPDLVWTDNNQQGSVLRMKPELMRQRAQLTDIKIITEVEGL